MNKINDKELFIFRPDLLDLVLTQTNAESQDILYDALNSNLISNKSVISSLLYYTDNPKIQRKIIKYCSIPQIMSNEMYLLSMINIDSERVEAKMLWYFMNNDIYDCEDYLYKLNKAIKHDETRCKILSMFNK